MKNELLQSKIISVKHAVDLHNEYESNFASLIETKEDGEYQATEFAWVELETLKSYIAMLDEASNLNNKEISGVRFYFGAYPNAQNFNNSSEKIEYPGRETFFMVPTVEVENTALSDEYENLEHLPICIKSISENPLEGDFVIIKELLHEDDNKTHGTTDGLSYESTSLILNKFALTPPPKG